jgi:hypothetical protein
MRWNSLIPVLFVLAAVTMANVAGADALHSPKAGSTERKAIMNALRVPVERKVRKKVIFKVGQLKVKDGWALMAGTALMSDGSALGDEFLWGEVSALLRREKNRWRVLHWGFATDTSVIEEARRKYPRAPRAIFP